MIEKDESSDIIPYHFEIVGRHTQVTEPMRQYAIDKICKIERFHPHILDVHVTLDIQKMEHSCVIIIHWNRVKIKVHASSNDIYTSIDRAAEKLREQVRRWKSRIQDHHAKSHTEIDMQVNVIERPFDELEDFNSDASVSEKSVDFQFPKIIGNKTLRLKLLTKDEAIMKLELSGDLFLVYRDEITRKLQVMYRTDDGNYGLIQPE